MRGNKTAIPNVGYSNQKESEDELGSISFKVDSQSLSIFIHLIKDFLKVKHNWE